MFIIGITGPSSSGKTTISKKLGKKLDAKLVHLDNYWKYHNAKIPSRNDWKKWEHPSSINFNKLYEDIIKLEKIHKRKKFIIIEGFHILYNKQIRDIFDLSIYVKVPNHLIIKRRVNRFGPENNQKWYSKNIVIKAYKKYIEPTKKYADLVIKGNKDINKNIKEILDYIKK